MNEPDAASLPPAPAPQPPELPEPGLLELLRVSLLLGLIGFGGGISVLGIIESIAVVRRRWLSREQFATTATVAQMLPGGAASNALAYIGLRLRGVPGAVVAYTGFVTPGAVLVTILAWVYVKYGAIPGAGAFLSGINAAVVGVILAIAVRMSRTGIGRMWQMGVTGAALAFSLVGGAGAGEVAILGIGAGVVCDLGFKRARLVRNRRRWRRSPPVALPEEGAPLGRASSSPPPPGRKKGPTVKAVAFPLLAVVLALALPPVLRWIEDLFSLAVVFFRSGMGAYGGGFAVIPSFHAQVVAEHLATDRQVADAVAVGKLTPGPVLLMATFIGYLKAGVAGAAVSTVAILAAPFLLVTALASWLDRVHGNRWIRAALRGLTPSVVGLMIAAALTLAGSMKTGVGAAIAASVALTLMRFDRVNPVFLLALGGAARVAYNLATGR
jgi:chromate transporter